MKDFINVNNAFELKTLGEICEINYGTRITKKKSEKGIYPVYGSGRATFTTNKFNREGFNILIGRFALSEECVRFTNEKLFLNDSGLSINTNYDKILHKYLCYYLIYNQNLIYNLARGTAQKNLNIEEFKLLQIPIPSLEKQNKIVNYLDLIESSNNLSNSKIESLKECNKFYIDGQIEIFSTEKINLGELCEINKGSLQSTKNIEGEYTFITASDEYKTHNKFTHDCECVMLVGGAEGSLAKSHYFKGKFIASDLLFILTSINENEINYKYLWYYLNFNKETHILDKNICCGTPKKMISKERCGNIKIPVLSLDMQNEIVRYCDDNNSLVQKLEEEIEKNKKQANLYLKNILQIQPQIEPETDSQEAESEASSEAASEAASSSKCEADD
jgi:restriction endonuclease S subunit